MQWLRMYVCEHGMMVVECNGYVCTYVCEHGMMVVKCNGYVCTYVRT